MRRFKISRWLAIATVCSLILATGCAPTGEEAVKPKEQISQAATTIAIAMKFSPQDSTTYKVTTERERNINWDGPVPDDPAFKGGRNHHRIETTFTQEIESVDDTGDATAKITFNEVKYSSVSKNKPGFNFDSSNTKDPKHPLAMLVGHSYTIKIAPNCNIIKIIDVRDAETAARKGSVIPVQALRLLKPQAIELRHGTLILPDSDKNQLHIGDNWSKTENLNFGMMGSESYEKIYTLNKIKGRKNKPVAFIEMEAIPASEAGQPADLLKDSDITKTYTGELELDLADGKVNNYSEELQQKWTVAFPATGKDANEGPAILTMTETRIYQIEKVD